MQNIQAFSRCRVHMVSRISGGDINVSMQISKASFNKTDKISDIITG